MEKIIKVNEYTKENGIILNWEAGAMIKCEIQNERVYLTANKEGLLSLANHFVNLSQDTIPNTYHIHFDMSNAFEDGSVELIVEKME